MGLFDMLGIGGTPEERETRNLKSLQKKLSEDEPNVFLFALAKVGVANAKVKGLWENDPVPANDVTGVSWAE